MASMTMPRPSVSSPLAGNVRDAAVSGQRIIPRRTPSFPHSRGLRPFPTISTTFNPSSGSKKSPTKLIVPPSNHIGSFVLNLTQAELSRQD